MQVQVPTELMYFKVVTDCFNKLGVEVVRPGLGSKLARSYSTVLWCYLETG